MSTYMDKPDKAIDNLPEDGDIERKKQMMWHCQHSPYTLRRDNSVSDGLNGNLELKDHDFTAADVEPGDTIHVLAERADDSSQTVEYTTDIYNDGRGFNLPIKHRRTLNLEYEDAVYYWIERVETPEDDGEDRSSKDAAGETPEQRTLSGEPVMEEPYVLIKDGSLVYHHLKDGREQTRCGIALGDDDEYQTFSDPGDVPLDECADCIIRDSKNMTNEQLARWIGDELGFEIGGGPPSYFSKDQLVKLRDFILEAKDAGIDGTALDDGEEDEEAEDVDE